MSLTEIMSGAGLAVYAQVALLLFFAAFILICWRVLSPRRAAEWKHAVRLPLDDEPTRTTPSSGTGE